ncbi:MAG TPA: hypothetical protein P5540_19110, partial [Candidatus Hydrogenedentes bacterium]|nr:hypothetical protein [Candidatus Hydrogenedentota bacterium]HRT66924.1 hypothetical protein [Candidatus Hydrogenedentota bacterium]
CLFVQNGILQAVIWTQMKGYHDCMDAYELNRRQGWVEPIARQGVHGGIAGGDGNGLSIGRRK